MAYHTCMDEAYRLSITMDAWKPLELAKMKSGGNATMNKYLESWGVPKNTEATLKYNSRGAEVYRERIKAKYVQGVGVCVKCFNNS